MAYVSCCGDGPVARAPGRRPPMRSVSTRTLSVWPLARCDRLWARPRRSTAARREQRATSGGPDNGTASRAARRRRGGRSAGPWRQRPRARHRPTATQATGPRAPSTGRCRRRGSAGRRRCRGRSTTHTEPPATARSVIVACSGVDAVILSVAGSILATRPFSPLATQTAPPAKTIAVAASGVRTRRHDLPAGGIDAHRLGPAARPRASPPRTRCRSGSHQRARP